MTALQANITSSPFYELIQRRKDRSTQVWCIPANSSPIMLIDHARTSGEHGIHAGQCVFPQIVDRLFLDVVSANKQACTAGGIEHLLLVALDDVQLGAHIILVILSVILPIFSRFAPRINNPKFDSSLIARQAWRC